MEFNYKRDYWAAYYANEDFIIIQTESGCGRYMHDHTLTPFVFNYEINNQTLGNAVLEALANSRTFIYGSKEDEDFFDLDKSQQRYMGWVVFLCEKLGYKTKRALFSKMKSGSIYLYNGKIEIFSTRKVGLDAWDNLPASENILLSLNDNTEKIGQSLRQAINRCL